MIKIILNKILLSFCICMASIFMLGCNKTESYTELLRSEQRAVNSYLAQHRVEVEVPADSIFVYGSDAPYYRMDEDGTIYMQVVNPGDLNDRPENGDRVYFRFRRMNLKDLYEYGSASWEGNMNNLDQIVNSTSFILGNKIYPTTTQFGTGMQVPMNYLGYYSEVNLILKSYSGFPDDQTACIPYVLNIKYYKAEY